MNAFSGSHYLDEFGFGQPFGPPWIGLIGRLRRQVACHERPSLARLLHDRGRPADAIACLRPIYDRFTEGFGTADLKAARALLG